MKHLFLGGPKAVCGAEKDDGDEPCPECVGTLKMVPDTKKTYDEELAKRKKRE